MRRFFVLAAGIVLAAATLPAQADPSGDLARASDHFARVKYVHAEINTGFHTIDVDYAAPNRYR